MSLHPTAVIHPAAELGPRVTVGPYAVIEGAARIGEGCIIQAHAIVTGHVRMGRENVIGYGAVIGGDPQDFAFQAETKSEVVIGDGNRIREHCTIHRGTSEGSATVVGDGCFLMAGAHLGHNARLGHRVVLANNALLGGHVQMEDGVFVGGGAVFHQHVRVGRLAICQGNSGFGKDLPPFCIGAEVNGVAGLNVIGMRRAGFSVETRAEIKEAFALLYRRGFNVAQALAAARGREWGAEARAFWDFAGAAKKKGLCDLLSTRHSSAAAPAEE